MAIAGRRKVFSVAVIVAAVAALAPASAGAVTARTADAFVESIGVNVHLGDPGTPYATNLPLVETRLEELGVRHVRGELYPKAPDEYQTIHDLAQHGIKSDMILGEVGEPAAALGEMLGELSKPELLGAIDGVEGYNEPYVNSEATRAHVIEHQQLIYEGINGVPALASIPVLGPSIIRNEQADLGTITSIVDDGNIHPYPQGGPPEEKVDSYVKQAQEHNTGTDPLFATETGYNDAISAPASKPGETRPVSEAAEAIYMPRLFFEYWTRHIARTYSYELLDDHPKKEPNVPEDQYGLLRNDLSEKPAFTALQNTIAILADPGASSPPGSLSYSLEEKAGQAKLHSTLLEKRDGSFYLALWRLQRVWNPETRQTEEPAREPLTVKLPAGVSSYAVYEPTKSSVAVASGGATNALPVEVGAAVTIVQLVPATPVPPAENPQSEPPAGEPEAPPIEISPTEPPAAPVSTASAPAEMTILTPPFGPPVTVPVPTAAPRCVVPKLKGRRLASARRTVRRAGCELGTVSRPTAEAAPGTASGPATVVAQRPRAGAALAAGSRVAVTLDR